jgi:hypothetical protein
MRKVVPVTQEAAGEASDVMLPTCRPSTEGARSHRRYYGLSRCGQAGRRPPPMMVVDGFPGSIDDHIRIPNIPVSVPSRKPSPVNGNHLAIVRDKGQCPAYWR